MSFTSSSAIMLGVSWMLYVLSDATGVVIVMFPMSVMSAKKHDKIFSITSHLPHLIAYNLVKSAQDFEKKQNYELIKYSAGGLRDFSRIAASNEIMWRDIFFNNKNNISKAIDLFIKNLNQFKKDISPHYFI